MKNSVKVLVVEDDYFITKNISEILLSEGHQVINNISTVNKAIDTIKTQKPDLVLIDIGLHQGDDGIKIGSFLAANSKTPFIYISSKTDAETLKRVKQTKPSGYVVKPFKMVDFKITLSLVLDNFYNRSYVTQNSVECDENISFRIKNVIEYVENNITNKLDINDLCELTRWKHHHFIRMFNKEIGLTPYQYILRTKIEHACKNINETDESLINIAYDLGFQNYIGFWRAFKKYMKKTPEEYKNSAQNKVYLS